MYIFTYRDVLKYNMGRIGINTEWKSVNTGLKWFLNQRSAKDMLNVTINVSGHNHVTTLFIFS